MQIDNKRRLSLTEAAQLIFKTDAPTAEQVVKVRRLIAKGVMAGQNDGHWSTSTKAVADYLATASLHRHAARNRSQTDDEVPAFRKRNTAEIRPIYNDLMSDYVMAMLMRRDVRQRSANFRRTVLAGQLIVVAAIMLGCLWLAVGSAEVPKELPVVEAYLNKKHSWVQIEEWHPPTPGRDGFGNNIQVVYQVKERGKPKSVEAVFSVRGDVVMGISKPRKAKK